LVGNIILRKKREAALVGDDARPALELAARRSDGFDVALYWDKPSGRLWVDVLHLHSGENLRIATPPAYALDAFYHPFKYCVAA
jgi:hypothetical protein